MSGDPIRAVLLGSGGRCGFRWSKEWNFFPLLLECSRFLVCTGEIKPYFGAWAFQEIPAELSSLRFLQSLFKFYFIIQNQTIKNFESLFSRVTANVLLSISCIPNLVVT